MCLVFCKAFWEESHRRYYVKIGPKPGSERILEPAWRTLLRIHFWIFYVFGNFWPPSSMWFDLLCVRSRALSAAKTKRNVSFRAIWYLLLLLAATGCWLLAGCAAAAAGCWLGVLLLLALCWLCCWLCCWLWNQVFAVFSHFQVR